MKTIKREQIIDSVRKMCIEAACVLENDVKRAISDAIEKEISPIGKEVLYQLQENAEIAQKEYLPICQDTGIAVVFVEIGQDIHIEGDIREAINQGVREGYKEGYLRKSVAHPITRKNTLDNTPAIIHFNIVPGDKLKITLLPKGGGSENMSGYKMLTPAAGIKGVKEFIITRVKEAGSNPCPPIVVGVGIGGTMEYCTFLAKKALIRPLGQRNPDPEIAKLEEELLEEINKLGIGPAGLGGRVTALAVNIEVHPCHITSLPVAVNIECHAHRHKEVVL
jgi:fumarate hydratase subunit alpha